MRTNKIPRLTTGGKAQKRQFIETKPRLSRLTAPATRSLVNRHCSFTHPPRKKGPRPCMAVSIARLIPPATRSLVKTSSPYEHAPRKKPRTFRCTVSKWCFSYRSPSDAKRHVKMHEGKEHHNRSTCILWGYLALKVSFVVYRQAAGKKHYSTTITGIHEAENTETLQETPLLPIEARRQMRLMRIFLLSISSSSSGRPSHAGRVKLYVEVARCLNS